MDMCLFQGLYLLIYCFFCGIRVKLYAASAKRFLINIVSKRPPSPHGKISSNRSNRSVDAQSVYMLTK